MVITYCTAIITNNNQPSKGKCIQLTFKHTFVSTDINNLNIGLEYKIVTKFMEMSECK